MSILAVSLLAMVFYLWVVSVYGLKGQLEEIVTDDDDVKGIYVESVERVESIENVEKSVSTEVLNEEIHINQSPSSITLLVLKKERLIEVWFENEDQLWLDETYPVVGASGVAGPKLKQGDKQVPEGVYNITSINMESRFDIAMLINYPNAFDKERALEDGRENLGGAINIHGGSYSIGCIAIGDSIQPIYEIVNQVGIDQVAVVILPYDFRECTYIGGTEEAWVDSLYLMLQERVLRDLNR